MVGAASKLLWNVIKLGILLGLAVLLAKCAMPASDKKQSEEKRLTEVPKKEAAVVAEQVKVAEPEKQLVESTRVDATPLAAAPCLCGGVERCETKTGREYCIDAGGHRRYDKKNSL